MSMGEVHPRWFELSDGVDTVSVTKYDALNYSQDYSYQESSTLIRFMNGRGFKTSNWTKLATSISGSGIMPIGIGQLDYSGEVLLRCGAPRSIMGTTNVIAMPPYRVDNDAVPTTTPEYREDDVYAPIARGWVDGFWEPTPVSISGNVATCTILVGATRYMVQYFPEIVVLFEDRPTESYDVNGDSSWSLSAVQK